MSLTATVLAGRRAHESTMTDECLIVLEDSEPVYDAETDSFTADPDSIVYTGRCKVQSTRTMGRTPDAGEQVAVVARRQLHLPVNGDSAGVRPNQVATLTSCPHNPALVGRPLRLADLGDEKSHATARRFGIEESG